jgi:epoxyqueuosine reductase
MTHKDDPALWLSAIITDFIERSPENTLRDQGNEKAFENPLVGFSRGDDPMYQAYKEFVGTFHWTPHEIFAETFPALLVDPKALTVISWILPQTEVTKRDNRAQDVFPSARWARTRIHGEDVNVKVRNCVVAALQKEGYEAVAPVLSPNWSRKQSDRYKIASTWSERHAAYASGLGTFGLCDGLITPRGKAVRIGSVVARIHIPPTPRPYDDHHVYCLFFTDGICGKCISRCPADGISEAGHDTVRCAKHTLTASSRYIREHYGFNNHP